MAIRYYLIPKTGDGLSMTTAFRPKYVDHDAIGAGWNVDGRWTGMDYGLEAVFLVAMDLTAGEQTSMAAQADVVAVPTPLSTQVSGAGVTRAQTVLEAINLPADWITTSLTWQQVLTRVARIIQIMQRFHGLFGRLFQGGLTLDSTISQIPAGQRTRLAQAAVTFGADTSSIVGATTIRAALVIVADQLFPSGIAFGGVNL